MNTLRLTRIWLALLFATVAGHSPPVMAEQQSQARPRPAAKDGPYDFDWEMGHWKTRVSRLQKPLTGSRTWVEYEGTSLVRKIGNGPANLVELDVAGPAGRIQGLSLRLYNPQSRQWSLNYSSNASGTLSPPVTGGFRDGRGEFHGLETIDGRVVLVRFVISEITPDSARFVQSYSDDGGQTWEANWIATDTRIQDTPPKTP